MQNALSGSRPGNHASEPFRDTGLLEYLPRTNYKAKNYRESTLHPLPGAVMVNAYYHERQMSFFST